jgi:hypothetical protein
VDDGVNSDRLFAYICGNMKLHNTRIYCGIYSRGKNSGASYGTAVQTRPLLDKQRQSYWEAVFSIESVLAATYCNNRKTDTDFKSVVTSSSKVKLIRLLIQNVTIYVLTRNSNLITIIFF